MLAQVQATPVTYSFSTFTADCGSATFSLVENYIWASLTQDTGTSTATITIAPFLNSHGGVYQLTLEAVLDSYPSAPTITSTFQVSILETVN